MAGVPPGEDANGDALYVRVETEEVRQILADLQAKVYALGHHASTEAPGRPSCG